MHTVFSTAGVPAAQAFGYWQDVIGAKFPGREVMPFARLGFYAEMKAGVVGDLSLVTWRSGPGITRGPSTDDLFLMLPSSRAHVEFADCSFETNRRSLYLIDTRKAHVARSFEPECPPVSRRRAQRRQQ